MNLTLNQVLVGGEVQEGVATRNPDRPSNVSSTILDNDGTSGRGTTRMTSPEKWEIKQVKQVQCICAGNYLKSRVHVMF